MKSRHKRKNAIGQLTIFVSLFLFGGVFLFLHAWLPVQAQRKFNELESWEKKISDDKSYLQSLNQRYLQKTSLPLLDQWAKKQGSWRNPKEKDVFLIHE